MSLLSFLLILTGVLLNAAAQLLLKAGTNALGPLTPAAGESYLHLIWHIGTEWHIMGGLTAYVFSVAIWILALSKVEVSLAYPMLSIGYVVSAFAGWYFFGEAVTAMRLLGIAVIIAGVTIVARS